MTEPFPPKISAPAARALAGAGISSLGELATWTEHDLLALHGVGPKVLDPLRSALTHQGLAFRSDPHEHPVASPGAEAVDAYLANLPRPQREALDRLRATLRSLLPRAEEGIRYGVPTFSLDGKSVAAFAAARSHLSYFPMSGVVLETAGDAVASYPRSKGGLEFGLDHSLPVALVRRLVTLRLAELATVTTGRRSEYYSDGQVKAVGPMKDGQLQGRWKWFRRDGTLMRTGQFSHGRQTGTWTTWDRNGNVVRVTRY